MADRVTMLSGDTFQYRMWLTNRNLLCFVVDNTCRCFDIVTICGISRYGHKTIHIISYYIFILQTWQSFRCGSVMASLRVKSI